MTSGSLLKPDEEGSFLVRIGPQGRIVIPAAVRDQLGLESESEILVSAIDGNLTVQSESMAWDRLREIFGRPVTQGAVDELIAERRIEGWKETLEALEDSCRLDA